MASLHCWVINISDNKTIFGSVCFQGRDKDTEATLLNTLFRNAPKWTVIIVDLCHKTQPTDKTDGLLDFIPLRRLRSGEYQSLIPSIVGSNNNAACLAFSPGKQRRGFFVILPKEQKAAIGKLLLSVLKERRKEGRISIKDLKEFSRQNGLSDESGASGGGNGARMSLMPFPSLAPAHPRAFLSKNAPFPDPRFG